MYPCSCISSQWIQDHSNNKHPLPPWHPRAPLPSPPRPHGLANEPADTPAPGDQLENCPTPRATNQDWKFIISTIAWIRRHKSLADLYGLLVIFSMYLFIQARLCELKHLFEQLSVNLSICSNNIMWKLDHLVSGYYIRINVQKQCENIEQMHLFKGSATRFSTLDFFHISVSPKPLRIPLPLRIFSKIHGDIRSRYQ